jgi:hypothetical protein
VPSHHPNIWWSVQIMKPFLQCPVSSPIMSK